MIFITKRNVIWHVNHIIIIIILITDLIFLSNVPNLFNFIENPLCVHHDNLSFSRAEHIKIILFRWMPLGHASPHLICNMTLTIFFFQNDIFHCSTTYLDGFIVWLSSDLWCQIITRTKTGWLSIVHWKAHFVWHLTEIHNAFVFKCIENIVCRYRIHFFRL